MFPPSCLKDTRHSLVKNCSMVTRDRKEPPSENSRDLFFFQSLSHVCLFATPWTATHQASLSFTISWSLLKFMSIESVMPSNYLVLCCPLLLLPSIFPSIRVFSDELTLWSGGQSIGVSASASVLPMNIQGWFPLELTGFISLQPKGLSKVFSNTTVQKHQFFGAQPSLWSNSHITTIILIKIWRDWDNEKLQHNHIFNSCWDQNWNQDFSFQNSVLTV